MTDDELPAVSNLDQNLQQAEASRRDWAVEAQRVEEIARQAVVLCADLLRRYVVPGSPGFTGLRTNYEHRDRVHEWGRLVLGWQAELDGTNHEH